jgi:hypothetical protein
VKRSSAAKRRRSDQSGQGTTEYILLLATVLLIFMVSMRGVLFPALKRLGESVTKTIEDGFKGDLHRLPFGSPRKN